jgi:nucleotide-binding universal stress UspA family protein
MFKKIAFGVDGSDEAKRALPFAIRLAEHEGASLILIHIEEDVLGKGGGKLVPNEDEVQAQVRRQGEELAARGVDVSVRMASVMVGGPAPAIARIAHEEGADLIVVASRGHSATIGVMLGSVAQRLPHVADQPVLVVPERASLPGDAPMAEPAAASSGQ